MFHFFQAGIVSLDQPDHLLIALEPEAASIYCRRLRMFHILSADDKNSRASLSDLSLTSSLSLPELRSNDVSLVSNDLDVGMSLISSNSKLKKDKWSADEIYCSEYVVFSNVVFPV